MRQAAWAMAACMSIPAWAQGAAPSELPGPLRAFVEGGAASHVRSGRVGLSLDWPLAWQLGPLRVGGYTEITAGRWQVDSALRTTHDGFTQVGLTPVFRFWASPRKQFFGELGIGLNVIGPKFETREKAFSTQFQFGDQIGIGWRAPGSAGWEVSLRFQHFSNGSIREPNPGQNFTQLRVGAAF